MKSNPSKTEALLQFHKLEKNSDWGKHYTYKTYTGSALTQVRHPGISLPTRFYQDVIRGLHTALWPLSLLSRLHLLMDYRLFALHLASYITRGLAVRAPLGVWRRWPGRGTGLSPRVHCIVPASSYAFCLSILGLAALLAHNGFDLFSLPYVLPLMTVKAAYHDIKQWLCNDYATAAPSLGAAWGVHTDTTSLASKSLRRMLRYEQIFCGNRKHTCIFFLSPFHSSVSQPLAESPFLQWRNAAFQIPLAESPRDVLFCSFLI